MPAGRPRKDDSARGKKRRHTESVSFDTDDDVPAVRSKSKGASISKSSGASNRESKPAELFRKDLISAMKMPDSEPLLTHEYIQINDPWKQEWEKGVQVPVNQDITKRFRAVVKRIPAPAQKPGVFSLPERYILTHADEERFPPDKFELIPAHETDDSCRYDLDDLDVAWLERCNEERVDCGLDPVPEWKLESAMEAIELLCHENIEKLKKTTAGLGLEFDESSVCNVCQCPDSEDGNEMVFCDGCDVCVHQQCYGIQNIPDGKWYCRTCSLAIKPQCELCPKRGGAMKPNKNGQKWAHVSCALWMPEVVIADPDKMEPITKIKDIKPQRWNLLCCLCRNKQGACIQCSVGSCTTAFHVTCAFEHGLDMKTEVSSERADDQADSEDEEASPVEFRPYCPRHSTGKSKRDAQRAASEGMTDEQKADARSEKLKELESRFYVCVSVDDVLNRTEEKDRNFIQYVYEYWKLKRRSNHNKPLIPPKDEAELLVKQQEGTLLARHKMFVQLRQDLEKVRNLCYMISRREKQRREFYRTRKDIFYTQLKVIQSMALNKDNLEIVIDANHSKSVYDNSSMWDFKAHGGDAPVITARPPTVSTPSSSSAEEEDIPKSRTECVKFPPRTQEQLHPTNPWKISKALQDRVHSKIFHPKLPRPYINGISDQTHRKLSTYFKPLPKTISSRHQKFQLYGSNKLHQYQDVLVYDGKENGFDTDQEEEIVIDGFLYPRVSDQFPQRVSRTRLTENLSKIWHTVPGL